MPSSDPPPRLPPLPSTKPNLDLTATHLEHLTLRLAQAFHDNTSPTSTALIRSLSARNVETHCEDAGADEFIPNSICMPIDEYIGHLQAYSKKFPDWDVVIHPPKAEVEAECKSAVVWLKKHGWQWYRYEHLDGVAGYMF